MSRPIAMTAFATRRDRTDERPTGAKVEAERGRNVDYALIIVGVVYVAFAILGFFAGDISVY
jgi:hypothetical protein